MDQMIGSMTTTSEDEGRIKFKDYEGRVFKIECKDPYGFWYIKPIKGQLPTKLSGSYTSYSIAARELDTYMEQEKKNGERRTQRSDG